jgi:hypothetical protein
MRSLRVPKSKTGFVSRKIDINKVKEINRQYGKSIFITCGKSANLEDINVNNFDGCIFTTSGINITGNCNVVMLPVDILDTQNYIAASDIIFGKAGWGTIAEALMAKSKLVLIEREDVIEDTHNITELKNRNLAISIKESDLNNLDIPLIEQDVNKGISMESLNMYQNQSSNIIEALGLS